MWPQIRALGFALLCVSASSAAAQSSRGGGDQPQARSDSSGSRQTSLGVTLADVPDSLRSRGAPGGALAVRVQVNSPAATAGLHVGDVITRIGRDTVRNMAEALAALGRTVVGAQVELLFTRNGDPYATTFTARAPLRETTPEVDSAAELADRDGLDERRSLHGRGASPTLPSSPPT